MRYKEKKVHIHKKLREVIEDLEQDEGIRILGKDDEEGFLFVTREEDRYCVSVTNRVYTPELRKHLPGKRERWFYPKDAEAVWEIVSAKAEKPIRAWVY